MTIQTNEKPKKELLYDDIDYRGLKEIDPELFESIKDARIISAGEPRQEKNSSYIPELNTQTTIDGAKSFGMGDTDPKKDGGSVAPEVIDKSEVVDKLEVGESDEKEKAELKEQIEQYNKYVQEALKIEEQVQEIGAKMGAAKEEVLAAIVNEEDGFFHPSTSPLVRDRLAKERSMLVGGDENLKKILTEYNKGLSDLDDLAKKIESFREEIDKLFGDLLTECKDQKQVASLRDFVSDMKFYDNKLQILQRDEVEAKYQDMKEWLAARSARMMAEIYKSNKTIKKEPEEPMVSAVTEEKPRPIADQPLAETIELSKPEQAVAEPATEVVGDSKKVDLPPTEPAKTEVPPAEAVDTSQMVGMETFDPNKKPVIEQGDAPEDTDFGTSQNLRAPGDVEVSNDRGNTIARIQAELNKPPVDTNKHEKAGILETETDADMGNDEETLEDLQQQKLKINLKNPEDGGGVVDDASTGIPEAEPTIPETVVPEAADTNAQPDAEMPAIAQEGTIEVATPVGEAPKPAVQEEAKTEVETSKVEITKAPASAENTPVPTDVPVDKKEKLGLFKSFRKLLGLKNNDDALDSRLVAGVHEEAMAARASEEETSV